MTRIGKAATWIVASVIIAGPAASQPTAEVDNLRQQIGAAQSRLNQIETQQQDTPAGVQEDRQTPATHAATAVETERDGVRLTLAGRVNQAVLFASQGGRDQAFVLDNDASGSRFELLAETQFYKFTTGVEIVVSAEVNSSDEIGFGETVEAGDEDNALDFRQAHWFIESERFGYFSIGQGDTAAEDTAHADLSGTDFAGSGSDVDDIAGGLVFASDDGTELARLDDFFDMQDGSRALRVLYETPDIADGFTFRASLENNAESFDAEDDAEGDGLSPAAGITFRREFDSGLEITVETSWQREERDEGKGEFIVGSASVLLPSGANLTVAASRGDLDWQDAVPTAIFAKVGYTANWWDVGETRFSFDHFNGENGSDFVSAEGDLPEARSYGFFAVQDIADLNTELYAGMRVYELEGVHIDGEEKDVDDLTALLAGAQVRF